MASAPLPEGEYPCTRRANRLRKGIVMASTTCGKRRSRAFSPVLTPIAAVVLIAYGSMSMALDPSALPTGGQVVGGAASIVQTSPARLDINQQSQQAALNWMTFNIGSGARVNFNQPNSSAIALNRVLGGDASQIFGQLTANGRIFLVNPSGVLFGPTARVDVGGIVASSLDLSAADFMAGRRTFANGTGSVVNQGTLTAADGGYIALLGPNVSNQGVIVANLGTVALGAGQQISLDFAGDKLLNLIVNAGDVNAQAANSQLIRADGGTVIMTAKAASDLASGVVNNSGIVQARSLASHNGVIRLLGDMEHGSVQVSGTLDASAPNGGDGGFIETSAAKVKVADSALITTAAIFGRPGTWLIDPNDYTISPTGDISGTTLSASLGGGNVEILSSGGGTAGSGNVNVNDVVSWSANNILTLTAANNVNVNANITATGNSPGLVLNPNTANGADPASGTGTYNLNNGAQITLSGTNPSLSIAGQAYTVINSLGVAGDTSGTTLQGISGGLAGHYALGSNIDATATSGWNSAAGFLPIGDPYNTSFTGTFDGLGHTINNLSINRPSTEYAGVGLFGSIGSTGLVKNTGLTGGSVTGGFAVGSLAGYSSGTVSDSYATGSVSGGSNVGGLVGYNAGTVSNSYATGPVSGNGNIGGLVGINYGTVSNVYATGAVTGAESSSSGVGGLVGINVYATVTNAYATGAVSGAAEIGGLVGQNVGGTVNSAYATGTASGASHVGGLVGHNTGIVSNVYATGAASASSYVGGLVGYNSPSGTVSRAFATGAVSGTIGNIGGLAGYNDGTILTSFWDTSTSGTATGIGGGTIAGATGMTTADMMTLANFTSATPANGNVNPGWDFANSWYMVGGNTRPILRSEYSTSITNAHQLQLIGMNETTLGASYTLANNISMAELSSASGVWNTSTGFVPIGDDTTAFTGSFDGLGHTIDGLTINMPSGFYVGLFGKAGAPAIVKNIGLAGGSVTGNYGVGALLGHNDGGTVINAYATGAVSGQVRVGGLLGYNAGTLTDAYATGAVMGAGNSIGGLVGYNAGTLSDVYATGTVSGSTQVGGLVGGTDGGTVSNAYATGVVSGFASVGGLVGENNNGTVSNAYATGAVSGYSSIGGLVGHNIGNVSNVYASGVVTGTNVVGGLVGENAGATVSNAYSTGTVSGSTVVGGLVGDNYEGAISNSFWDTTTSGTATGIGGGTIAGATGMTTADMMALANFTSATPANGNVNPEWDFTNTWYMVDSSTRPILRSEYSTTIINAHQLQLIGMNATTLGASYTLANDISMAELSQPSGLWNTSTGFVPIGSSAAQFTGTFDGLGHTINNLSINRPTTDYVGLFGYTGTGSAIRNVGLVDGSVSARNYVGGLVGYSNSSPITNSYSTGSISGGMAGGLVGFNNNSLITNSYSTGSISGTNRLGGLVGHNELGTITNSYGTGAVNGLQDLGGLVGFNAGGTVTNSYSTGSVTGAFQSGGLVGRNYYGGIITNSYSTGSVSGWANYYFGGLVGTNEGTVSSSYATGSVSGPWGVGGLVGYNAGTISASFWDTATSGTSTGVGYGTTTGATGMATADMMTRANFNSATAANGNVNPNWDMSNTWHVPSAGGAYPILFNSPFVLKVLGNDASKIYGDANPALSYVTSGFWGSDTASRISGLSVATAATTSSSVGTYDIMPSGGSGTSSTGVAYVFAYVPGTLTVNKATLSVTADNASRIYGNADPTFTGSITGFKLGQDASVLGTQPSYATTALQSSDVGSYAINGSGAAATNYDFTYTSGTLTVDKATLNVTADDKSRGYGDSNPVFTSTITGFKLGQDASVLGTQPDYATTALQSSGVGGYAINASSAAATNYDFIYTAGTLTVDPRAVTLTGTRVYDGTTGISGGVLTASNLVSGDSLGITGSGTLASKNAGSEPIVGFGSLALSNGNYTLTGASGSVMVTALPVTLTIGAVTKTYDGGTGYTATPFDLASLSGSLVGGDAVTEATIAYADKNAGLGNKAVSLDSVTIGDGNGGANYSVTRAGNAASTIEPLTVILTGTRPYDGTTDIAGGMLTAANLVARDSLDITGSGTLASKNVGSEPISDFGSLALSSSNYTLAGGSGAVAITPAALTVTARNVAKTYGQTPPLTGFIASGLQNGETIGSVTETSAGAAATASVAGGPYVITVSDATGGTFSASNYDITYVNGALKVTRAPLTVTADNARKFYGQTITLTGFTSSGLQNGEAIGSVTERSPGAVWNAAIGNYAITPSAATGGTFDAGNYKIFYVNGKLKVRR
jgi:filamentous hemagglutinin family protein